MKYSTDKDIDKLLRALVRAGATVRFNGGTHLTVRAEGCKPVFLPSSPSCRTALQITRRKLRPIMEAINKP